MDSGIEVGGKSQSLFGEYSKFFTTVHARDSHEVERSENWMEESYCL